MAVNFHNDLDASFLYAWQQLRQAITDRSHGFRTLQLATVTAEATPNVRTVILRHVDQDQYSLQFHTDSRSGKVAEMRHQPRVALHAYDEPRKLQLRLYGQAELHQADALARRVRTTSGDTSRFYDSQLPGPGEPLADPAVFDQAASANETDLNEDCFVAVNVAIDTLEWLYLPADGHRRARWLRETHGWTGQWLVP